MWNQIELESLELNMLAMLCLRVAESGMANSEEREEAGRLRREWAMFIGDWNPVLHGLDTQQDIKPYEQALRQRMVTYLAGFSHRESSQAQPASTSNAKAWVTASGRAK
jgi:hypothetical protein